MTCIQPFSAVAIIPTHLASVRFPGKILADICGLPMIEHVRRRALMSPSIEKVVVATCDDEIASVVQGFGGDVIMTSTCHRNGTTRVAEAVNSINCSHVVLVQGDEPLLIPDHITQLVASMNKAPHVECWNATAPIHDETDLDRHSFVKCVVSQSGRVVYCFRRSPCFAHAKDQFRFVRKILGLIAFRKDFLLSFDQLGNSLVEQFESIEQMRIIENGYTLMSFPVFPALPSVNEPSDVSTVVEYLSRELEQNRLLDLVFTLRDPDN
jgi:3-deoxy-manno-octulosonate cytidylyltransferase (CMP-KDO synthetase)